MKSAMDTSCGHTVARHALQTAIRTGIKLGERTMLEEEGCSAIPAYADKVMAAITAPAPDRALKRTVSNAKDS